MKSNKLQEILMTLKQRGEVEILTKKENEGQRDKKKSTLKD